jgi:hypothetical protein
MVALCHTNGDSIGFWFHMPINNLTRWTKVLANRIAAEAEAEAKAKAAREPRPKR